MPDELLPRRDDAPPADVELENLDAAIAEIELHLALAAHESVGLRDRREDLLAGRAELRRRRERAGLIEEGALVQFFGIDYEETVAQYFDPDPNLMRGDGLRQKWPPGALAKIRRAKLRR